MVEDWGGNQGGSKLCGSLHGQESPLGESLEEASLRVPERARWKGRERDSQGLTGSDIGRVVNGVLDDILRKTQGKTEILSHFIDRLPSKDASRSLPHPEGRKAQGSGVVLISKCFHYNFLKNAP